MKQKKKLIMLLLSLLLIVAIFALSGEVNIKYIFASMLYDNDITDEGNIIFSKKSGFYNKDFKLYLFAPTEEIYYTLDGSEPDCNSIKYEDAIFISDASKYPNKYSERTDITSEFLEKEVQKYSKEKYRTYYQVPDYKVDKCTTIKVAYYDKKGNRSKIEERVYFVDYKEKRGYENVNIISIVTDPKNLFDYETGIYVLGKTFDNFRESGELDTFWAKEYWEHWKANYHNRGIDWERESFIQVFDTERNQVVSQRAGIRIQGGASRGFLPKSLNIYARKQYGANKLYYDFFGTGYYPQRITLSTGGDDFYTKIKDKLVSELARGTNIATMNYRPYALFLNGEYWGFYYLTEKYDENYIEKYYGVDKGVASDNIIMIKNGEVETGEKEIGEQLYSEMLEFIIQSDMGNEENFQRACEMIDLESFIDYFAVLGYVSRCGDWPESNVALWRSKNISAKENEDGKWRWILFDVNSTSLQADLIEHDLIRNLRETSPLFNSLCANELFRTAFSKRLLELSDTIFEKEYVNQKISEYVELMEEPMEKHYHRFFGTSNERFKEGVEEIRYFFDQRRPYVLKSIQDNFGEKYLGK